MTDRATIRDLSSQRVRGLSREQHAAQSQQLCDRLHDHDLIRDARTIAAHWPVRGEANILPLLRDLLANGVRVALPVIQGPSLVFALSPSLLREDMDEGPFDIPQPTGPRLALHELDLILVPGRAFDRQGNRLGSGGGYYDRALASSPDWLPRVGVALSCQIWDERIPTEDHDVRMHWVAHEHEVIRVGEET